MRCYFVVHKNNMQYIDNIELQQTNKHWAAYNIGIASVMQSSR